MEEYNHNYTIVENAIYNAFRESVECPLCLNVLFNPHMCMKCQNVYCKKCIDDWSKKSEKCPNRCEEPNYKRSLVKNEILSRLQFKCKKCGSSISYDDMQKHYENCNPEKHYKKEEYTMETPMGRKLEKLSIDQVDKFRQKGNDITFITGN